MLSDMSNQPAQDLNLLFLAYSQMLQRRAMVASLLPFISSLGIEPVIPCIGTKKSLHATMSYSG